MYHYAFGQWLIFFYFYCICGWIFESVYVSVRTRKLTNRGFMKGPWLPLYGSGAVVVLFCTLPLQKWPAAVYFAGAFAATVLEYITGVAMVKLFKVRYWDYSNQKLQFQGHICVSSSIAWGFLSILMVYVVHKPVEHLIFKVPDDVISVLTFLITVCIVFDFANAFRDAMDLRKLLIQMEDLKKQLAEAVEERKAELAEAVEERKTDFTEAVEERRAQFVDAVEERRAEYAESMAKRRAEYEESVTKRRAELEKRLGLLKERMEKPSRHLLMHNPGSGFISLKEEAEELRRRFRDRKS